MAMREADGEMLETFLTVYTPRAKSKAFQLLCRGNAASRVH